MQMLRQQKSACRWSATLHVHVTSDFTCCWGGGGCEQKNFTVTTRRWEEFTTSRSYFLALGM